VNQPRWASDSLGLLLRLGEQVKLSACSERRGTIRLPQAKPRQGWSDWLGGDPRGGSQRKKIAIRPNRSINQCMIARRNGKSKGRQSSLFADIANSFLNWQSSAAALRMTTSLARWQKIGRDLPVLWSEGRHRCDPGNSTTGRPKTLGGFYDAFRVGPGRTRSQACP
jgi:hypothetical protein